MCGRTLDLVLCMHMHIMLRGVVDKIGTTEFVISIFILTYETEIHFAKLQVKLNTSRCMLDTQRVYLHLIIHLNIVSCTFHDASYHMHTTVCTRTCL